MKTAFIFDLDGTLAESYQALSASVEYVAQRAAEARAAMRGEQVRAETPEKKRAWPFTRDGKIQDMRLEKYEVSLDIGADFVDQVYSVFSQLYERGCKLAIVSSRPVGVTEKLMAYLALDGFIERIYGPESVGEAKPHPAMINRAILDLGVRPEDVLFVGDELVDIEMAHAAGVKIAAVVAAAGRTQCVSEAPDFILYNWPQVLSLVDG